MPRDAEFGRELAAQVDALYKGRITEVSFTYDSFLQIEDLGDQHSYCKISPQSYSEERESRYMFRETIDLSVNLVSPVGPFSNEQWIDEWLDSWDAVIRSIRDIVLADTHKPLRVDRDERYDSDIFHNHKRLFSQAIVHYANVQMR